MRDVGYKSTKTPMLLKTIAEYHASRGDIEKAITMIQNSEKIASEVLDGVSVHLKIANVLISKSNILSKAKKY